MLSHTQQDSSAGLVKPGSFLDSWKGILQKTHELGAHNLELSKTFDSCISSLLDLHKHTERSRKSCKDTVFKLKRSIEEALSAQQRTRQRLDCFKEEISKTNNAAANGTTYKQSVFKGNKPPVKVSFILKSIPLYLFIRS